MNIDLMPLVNETETVIKVLTKPEFNKEDLLKVDIRDLKDVLVKGNIYPIGDGIYNINLNISGTMVLACNISLEDVDYKFDIKVSEDSDSNEENVKIINNMLDIFPIVWENILLEKPSRIVKDNINVKTSGEGWSLVDEVKHENQLSDLKNLLDMEGRK